MTADAELTHAVRFAWERALLGSTALDSKAKLVGLTIATYAEPDGSRIHPGADRLVRDTSTSEATVRRALKQLVDAGFAVRVAGGMKIPGRARNKADEYRIVIPSTAGHGDCQSQGLPVTRTRLVVTEPVTGGHGDDRPVHDQSMTRAAAADDDGRDLARRLSEQTGAELDAAADCIAWLAQDEKGHWGYLRHIDDVRRVQQLAAKWRKQQTGASIEQQRDARRCPHGRVDGAAIRGHGDSASRICGECEAESPAQRPEGAADLEDIEHVVLAEQTELDLERA